MKIVIYGPKEMLRLTEAPDEDMLELLPHYNKHPGAHIRILDGTPLADIQTGVDPRLPKTIGDWEEQFPGLGRIPGE